LFLHRIFGAFWLLLGFLSFYIFKIKKKIKIKNKQKTNRKQSEDSVLAKISKKSSVFYLMSWLGIELKKKPKKPKKPKNCSEKKKKHKMDMR